MEIIQRHIDQINSLCLSNKVKRLFAFGSVTIEDFNEQSDVDLLVEIDDQDPISYSDKYFDLKFQLEKILNRQIDLLEDKAIKNRFFKEQLDRTRVLIYG